MTKPHNETGAPGALIYSRMTQVLAEVEAIAKDKKNKDQGFMYRSAEDIMNMIHPLLSKHKIFVATSYEDMQQKEGQSKSGSKFTESTIRMQFKFITDDGSFIQVDIPTQGRDYGDTSVYKCITMGMKYALTNTFCIPFTKLDGGEGDPKIESASGEIGTTAMPRISKELIDGAVASSLDGLTFSPLVAVYNSMPPDQQEECKELFTETRMEIELRRANKGLESGGKKK